MEVLRIIDWDKHFENNRSRDLKSLDWVPVPNKMDGDGYTAMLEICGTETPLSGAIRYGAWCSMVLFASKSRKRGYLFRSVTIPQEGAVGLRAHDPASMSRISRLPKEAFQLGIERALEIGWLERIELSEQQLIEIWQGTAGGCGKAPKELNGIELNSPPTPSRGRGGEKRLTKEEKNRQKIMEAR